MSALKTAVVNAPKTHTATIVFLHGLGDSGHGWVPVAKMLSPILPHVKWVLPHAPSRPITVNFGMAMPGWYDIHKLGPGGKEDAEGVMSSIAQVSKIVDDEIKAGIAPERIVVGGFSQGGALSIVYSLASGIKLGGFLSLSGYLPLTDANLDKVSSRRTKIRVKKNTNNETPMLMCHGDQDETVPYKWGKLSYEKIVELGKKVEAFKTYKGMGHSSSSEEVSDVAEFLTKVLP
ncbi:Phospholipase/carboxylesterase/thioesterase [Fimicolochytrium jonesii]|uniref:Phospholipase/carboxylesterase/thioesterase n=1 Tax=Fimicolochytrium jonesii TaxID=1396493 RepID=UPI0022FED462|nr:Phospholipase/carboxylesterase/thioesterase [Fimicolochytrium jonesii]KAI8820646.1 Phospholipase/carboxylesterase/thioesterase [Fimicolochytrium jonesii]